jgi:hypothetical protein
LIDSFELVVNGRDGDFGPLYGRIGTAPDIEAHELIGSNKVITNGTLAYVRNDEATVALIKGRSLSFDQRIQGSDVSARGVGRFRGVRG